MKKLFLFFVLTIFCTFRNADAQQIKVNVNINFDNVVFQGHTLYSLEQKYGPEWKKTWEKYPKDALSALIETISEGSIVEFESGIDSPYQLLVNVNNYDEDGEMEVFAELFYKSANESPVQLKTYERQIDNERTSGYTVFSIKGFWALGYFLSYPFQKVIAKKEGLSTKGLRNPNPQNILWMVRDKVKNKNKHK